MLLNLDRNSYQAFQMAESDLTSLDLVRGFQISIPKDILFGFEKKWFV